MQLNPLPFQRMVILLVGLWLSLSSAVVWAQTDNRYLLPKATIVAPRKMHTIHTATPAQEIDTTAFRRMGITSTADALRRLAGIHLRDYGGAGGLKTVSVRGLGSTHTAVVYDGITMSNTQNGAIDLGRFSLEELSSLSLHIADDAHLLVPVRQLSAATLILQSKFPTMSARKSKRVLGLSQGSFQTWQPYLSIAHTFNERQALSGRLRYFHGKNDYPFVLKNGIDTHTERRNNSQMNDWTAEVNHRYKGRWGELCSKWYGVSNHRYLPDRVYLYNNESHEHLTEHHSFVQSQWQQQWGQWQTEVSGKWEGKETRYLNLDPAYLGGRMQQNYWQQEVYSSLGVSHMSHHWQVALATDYIYNTLHSNLALDSRVDRHSWLTALSVRFVQPRWQITSRLIGANIHNRRADHSTAARNVRRLSPSLSLMAKLWQSERGVWSVHGHFKEFFRMPTFTENYYFHLGNPHLRPENTYQWGVGTTFHQKPSPTWQYHIQIDGYHNRVTDKIVSIPYNLFVWRTLNLAKVYATGLDVTASLQYRPREGQTFIGYGQMSYQSIVDHSDRKSLNYGKQLPYTPPYSGSASLAWENPWLNLSVSLTACAARWSTEAHLPSTRMKGYTEGNIGVYKSWQWKGQMLNCRADLLNVFNTDYEIIRRYPMPRRAYKLSLEYVF